MLDRAILATYVGAVTPPRLLCWTFTASARGWRALVSIVTGCTIMSGLCRERLGIAAKSTVVLLSTENSTANPSASA